MKYLYNIFLMNLQHMYCFCPYKELFCSEKSCSVRSDLINSFFLFSKSFIEFQIFQKKIGQKLLHNIVIIDKF